MRLLMLLVLLLPALSFGSPESEKRRFEEQEVLAEQALDIRMLKVLNSEKW